MENVMNLKNKISSTELKAKKNILKKIFFFRIAGTGMGAAACLFKEAGYHIEGSDLKFAPPMGDYLRSTGIPLHEQKNVTPELLKSFDLIVVGNVVSGKSEDARMIESLGVPFISFPEALGALVLDDVNVVGIAGTHGKTTTTFLFTQVFENLGTNPGYFIGGVIDGRASSRLGGGKYFFIESDEYDSAYFEKISKFRLYSLDHLILTSLEFDHADIFKDIEAIKDQFRALIPGLKGKLIYNSDYKAASELQFEYATKKWMPYSFNKDRGPFVREMDKSGTTFELIIDGAKHTYKTNVIGEHNILNLATVVLFAFSEGFTDEQINKAISDLGMVKRRQEVRGAYKGAIVIDDFAHHPTAVRVTVDTIRTAFPGKKLVVVLEPNSATARSDVFQKEFALSLLNTDYVVMAKPQLNTTAIGHGNLDCYQIVDDLKSHKRNGEVVTELTALRSAIDLKSNDQTVLLVLSNGTCLGLWESDFSKQLNAV